MSRLHFRSNRWFPGLSAALLALAASSAWGQVPADPVPAPLVPHTVPLEGPPPVSPAPVSMMAPAARAANMYGNILWVDGSANANWLNTVEQVQGVVDRSKAAGINSIVVDIKPLSGEVLYNSKYAPRMKEWKGVPYPADFDVLQSFINAGKAAGIPIYISMNIFSEGHKSFRTGPAYQNKQWQVISLETVPYVMGPEGDDRLLIARENEYPARNELAAYTAGDVTAKGDALYVAYDEKDMVVLIAEGEALNERKIPVPKGGGVLAGRGEARDWLLSRMKVDSPLRFTGESRMVRTEESRSDKYAVFVNNIRPDVRKHILNVIREVLEKYPVAGIYLDRMRYPNLHGDFSDESRRAFEKWLGRSVTDWPRDIVTFPARPGSEPVRGSLFNNWLEWRAHNITDFLKEARKVIRRARKDAKVGVYVGSWYSVYYDVGVNWGSPSFPDRYDWMTPTFRETGYAPLLDLMVTGTYYETAWKSQAPAAGVEPLQTVEGSAEESLAAVRDETVMYGSLYLVQYKDKPQAFRDAIRASLSTTGGVMIFDLIYLEEYGWWPILQEELPKGRVAPHDVPGFRESIQAARHAADKATDAPNKGKIIVAPTEHPPL